MADAETEFIEPVPLEEMEAAEAEVVTSDYAPSSRSTFTSISTEIAEHSFENGRFATFPHPPYSLNISARSLLTKFL